MSDKTANNNQTAAFINQSEAGLFWSKASKAPAEPGWYWMRSHCSRPNHSVKEIVYFDGKYLSFKQDPINWLPHEFNAYQPDYLGPLVEPQ